jgi:PTS system mannose-specific IIB component
VSIAIVIGTHGASAEQLLKSTEMVIGQQDNVAFIDFVPGENADTLIVKFNQKLSELDTTTGALFLVDFWGGSPFNAASRIVQDKDNMDIVTGVNIPMLVEVFMARDDNPQFSELVATAVETGKIGIKALKTAVSKPEPVKKKTAAPLPAGTGGHMTLGLVRIDDRLIHGQVATRWTKETNVNRIIVVSDDVAADNVRSTLLKQVAPPGVTASVVGVDKMIRVYNNPKYAKDRVMLLFTNPTDVMRIVDGGIPVKSVNIGGMAYRDGKTQVNNAVSIDDKDIEAFNKLNSLGIELEVRKVSSDSRISMMDLVNKSQQNK